MNSLHPGIETQPAEVGYSVGTVIAGRYTIQRFVGAGGMGWVFAATDRELNGQTVALKLVYPHLLAHASSIDLLRNEILISRRLTHPNIVQIYSFGEVEPELHFVAMELIDGMALGQYLQLNAEKPEGFEAGSAYRLKFPELVIDFVRAMAHAHECGIVHCDLKPDNLLLCSSGILKVADFGLARVLRNEHRDPGESRMVGTPYYMAPEQFRMLAADNRSDIYSFGIVLFELWTGKRPFDENSLYRLAQQHLNDELPLDALTQSDAPVWLLELITRSTEKDPEQRIQSFRDVWSILERNAVVGESDKLLLSISPSSAPARSLEASLRYRFRLSPYVVGTFLTLALLALGIGFARSNNSVAWRVWGVVYFLEHELGVTLGPLRSLLAVKGHYDDYDSLWTPHREAVCALMLAGVDPNTRGPNGDTVLTHSIRIGIEGRSNVDLARVRRVLNAGADLSLADYDGDTAIHIASRRNDDKPVRLLLDYKSPVNLKNNLGMTALHVAIESRSFGPRDLLLKSGAEINAQDKNGWTPLHYAAAAGDRDSILTLISKGALVNVLDSSGRAPLTLLAERGLDSDETAELTSALLKAGAIPDIKDSRGWSPHSIASSRKLVRMIRALDRALPAGVSPEHDVPINQAELSRTERDAAEKAP